MIKRVYLSSKTEYPGNSTIKFGENLNKLLWQPKSLTVLAYGISAQDHSLPNSVNLCLIHYWYWEVWRQWASSPQTGHRWTSMLRLINAVGTVQRDYVPVLQHSVCYCGESGKAASAQTSGYLLWPRLHVSLCPLAKWQNYLILPHIQIS